MPAAAENNTHRDNEWLSGIVKKDKKKTMPDMINKMSEGNSMVDDMTFKLIRILELAFIKWENEINRIYTYKIPGNRGNFSDDGKKCNRLKRKKLKKIPTPATI